MPEMQRACIRTSLASARSTRCAGSAAPCPRAHAAARSHTHLTRASAEGASGGGNGNGARPALIPGSTVNDDFWRDGGGFPHYLQSKKPPTPEDCDCSVPVGFSRDDALAWGNATSQDYDPMWQTIRAEAQADSVSEPLLSSFLYATILSHSSFEGALSSVLANRLACAQLLSTQLLELFNEVLSSDEGVRLAARCDVAATRQRDPACRTHADCLLYFKGYHAVQAYRIAHALWGRGQTLLAVALQSRCSEVFAVDIHPAARIGRGILLDHGTGVVIGETAVVGDRVSILQGVTLGGTGKDTGDRHPKIGQGVLIGAHACVLGNIAVGEGAMIAAGSLVLKSVAPHTMVAGSPAKEVGAVIEPFPSLSMRQEGDCLEWEKARLAEQERVQAEADRIPEV